MMVRFLEPMPTFLGSLLPIHICEKTKAKVFFLMFSKKIEASSNLRASIGVMKK